jgi:hypothetical protein
MAADRAELVTRAAAPDYRVILKMHVSGELNRIRAYDVIAENNTMGRMTVSHEKAVAADDGLLAVGGAEMDRGEFADHRAVADFDERNAPFTVFEILRLHADAGVGVDFASLAYRRVAVDDRALLDDRAAPDPDILSDACVGTHFDICAENGSVCDYGGMVNFGHFNNLRILRR